MKKRMKEAAIGIVWCVATVAVCALWIVVCALLAMGFAILMAIISKGNMNTESATNIVTWVSLIGWTIIIVVSIILWKRFRTRCPICKHWAAVAMVNTELIGETKISVPVKTHTRNRNGEIISTSEQYVPGSRYTYRHTYRCKYCGYEESRRSVQDCAKI